MTIADDAAKKETLARLAKSRAEIWHVFEPPSHASSAAAEERFDEPRGAFPRSRTMRLLLSGRGLSTVGTVVGGLLLARPALALRLLRMLPVGAVARTLLLKAVTTFRARHH